MIGVVVVSHGNIAKEMVRTVKDIVPETTQVAGVAIDSNEQTQVNRQIIASAIAEVNTDEGILLLTDMFGGTPSNLCLSFLNTGNIEVVSGVNLPMLIKLSAERATRDLKTLATFMKEYGKKNIVIASEVLNGEMGE